ncbi:MAG: hypothetical protein APF84_13350 [Gracilibacter sp. BRH_c7a]|nr:MAG: hypothetical protein APF84_13350 [Gracilibacter sp. BRH_c7a]
MSNTTKMIKKVLICLTAAVVLLLNAPFFVWAAEGKITFTMDAQVGKSDFGRWTETKTLNFYYSVSQDGQQVIGETPFLSTDSPNIRKTSVKIELDKISSEYTIDIYQDGTDNWGRTNSKKQVATLSVPGNKSLNLGFTCWDGSAWSFGFKDGSSDSESIINTEASATAGETDIPVPVAVVVGVLGAAAAVAAAGSAAGTGAAAGSSLVGSESGGENSEDENGSTYKMYIRKDFGNKIRYDKPAVTVYARMGEVKSDGTEIDRPDLTEQMEIFSGTGVLKVSSQTMAGNYMGALVEAETVKRAQNPTEGIISFKFTGEGGYFQNNVTFKLIGEPYITFPERGENLEMTVDMLYGDDGIYEVPFELVDFMEKPVSVKAQPQDGSPFSLELEAIDDFHYIARLQNTSTKPQKIQAQSKIFTINVTAENQTEYAKSTFRAVLYPEGISVRVIKYNEDGYALISAYEDTNTEEAGDVTPTRFLVELAVGTVDENGRNKAKLVDASEYKPEFAKLEGTNNRTEELVKRFQYEIKDAGKAAFTFQPLMQIPELENPYYVKLPITCEYAGETYTLDLPVRLIGEKLKPMGERKEELRLLLKRIRRYMPPEEWHDILAKIKPDLDKRSAEELRLLSKSVIYTAQARLLSEAAAQTNWAETLDWCIGALSVIKWVGDQAFSYLATVYTGPAGDAILSPMKDMLTALIGEAGASILVGEGFEYETLQLGNSVGTMLENLIMSSVDVSIHEIRQIASVLAGFAVVNVAKHYVLDLDKNGQRSFYNALLSGFGDITANCMKIAGGTFFEKAMKSKAAENAMKTYCGKWIRQYLVKYLPDIEIYFSECMVSIAKFDIVKKYIEELCGFGTVELFSRNRKEIEKSIDQAYKDTNAEITEFGKRLEASNYVVTITLWSDENNPDNSLMVDVDLMKVKDSLFDYIFDSICGIFPFPQNSTTVPGDPVFTQN